MAPEGLSRPFWSSAAIREDSAHGTDPCPRRPGRCSHGRQNGFNDSTRLLRPVIRKGKMSRGEKKCLDSRTILSDEYIKRRWCHNVVAICPDDQS
jgi:hypothetical protein